MHIPVNHKTQQTLPIKYNSKFSSCNRQIHQDNSICLSSNNNIMLPKRQIFFSLHMARNKCTIIILLIKEDPPAPQIKIIVMCDSAKDSRATLKSRSFKRILCRIILVRYSIQSAWKRTQKSFWPFSSQMTWGIFRTLPWPRMAWRARCPTPAWPCNKWSILRLSTVDPTYQASPFHFRIIYLNLALHQRIIVQVRLN